MNQNLTFLADSIIIESLARDNRMIIIAQDSGIISSVAEGVKNYVASMFDKKRPLASIAAFMGKGLLYSLGFRWIAILYTIAEALGFDWKSFWAAVGGAVKQIVKEIIQTKRKPSEQEIGKDIDLIVSKSVNNNFNGSIDSNKLKQLSKTVKLSFSNSGTTKFSSELNDALQLRSFALRINNSKGLVKESISWVPNILKGKLSRFFIKTISWLVKVALTSLGLTAGAGAISGLFGKSKEESEDEEGQEQEGQPTTSDRPAYNLQMSRNVSRDLFTVHRNDLSDVWIERGNVESVDQILINWILSTYPQLSDRVDDLKNSSSFQSIINKFRVRNRLASGLGIFSVPRPYERKIDIVSTVVNGFLRESSA